MDLIALNINAILVPTPGQTEQEYLAGYFLKKNIFYSESQKDFNLIVAMEKSKNFKMRNFTFNSEGLEERLKNL